MPTKLVANEWGVILRHDNDLLELQWLPSTAEMTDGGFMATLCLFASEAEKARARRLLIDATQFRHRFGGGVMAWRDAHILPRYAAVGYGDLAVAVVALVAVLSVRVRVRGALLVVWLFSLISIGDLVFATIKAVEGRMYTFYMGWNWYLLNFYVPMLVVSQVMIIYYLVQGRRTA